jgi:hydrogenase maturation protease
MTLQNEQGTTAGGNPKLPGVILIGVGNEYRTDDALGVLVARELRRRSPGGIRILENSGEGASLMNAWEGGREVYLVDAIKSGKPPGTVHRIDVTHRQVPRALIPRSSHAFGVPEAIETARTLGELPSKVILFGIEAETFDQGVGLSDSVLRSVPDLLLLIEAEFPRMLH